MIGDDVELTVVDIRGDKVRIGIKAPTHIAVHRKEVYDAIKNENQQAAQHAAIFRGEMLALKPRTAAVERRRPMGGTVLPTARIELTPVVAKDQSVAARRESA